MMSNHFKISYFWQNRINMKWINDKTIINAYQSELFVLSSLILQLFIILCHSFVHATIKHSYSRSLMSNNLFSPWSKICDVVVKTKTNVIYRTYSSRWSLVLKCLHDIILMTFGTRDSLITAVNEANHLTVCRNRSAG